MVFHKLQNIATMWTMYCHNNETKSSLFNSSSLYMIKQVAYIVHIETIKYVKVQFYKHLTRKMRRTKTSCVNKNELINLRNFFKRKKSTSLLTIGHNIIWSLTVHFTFIFRRLTRLPWFAILNLKEVF